MSRISRVQFDGDHTRLVITTTVAVSAGRLNRIRVPELLRFDNMYCNCTLSLLASASGGVQIVESNTAVNEVKLSEKLVNDRQKHQIEIIGVDAETARETHMISLLHNTSTVVQNNAEKWTLTDVLGMFDALYTRTTNHEQICTSKALRKHELLKTIQAIDNAESKCRSIRFITATCTLQVPAGAMDSCELTFYVSLDPCNSNKNSTPFQRQHFHAAYKSNQQRMTLTKQLVVTNLTLTDWTDVWIEFVPWVQTSNAHFHGVASVLQGDLGSTGGLGATPVTGGFAQQTSSTVGQPPQPPFGQPAQQGGLFVAHGFSTTIEQPRVEGSGTGNHAWSKTRGEKNDRGIYDYFNMITSMPQYASHSVEELRFEDYKLGRRPRGTEQAKQQQQPVTSTPVTVAGMSVGRANRCIMQTATSASGSPVTLDVIDGMNGGEFLSLDGALLPKAIESLTETPELDTNGPMTIKMGQQALIPFKTSTQHVTTIRQFSMPEKTTAVYLEAVFKDTLLLLPLYNRHAVRVSVDGYSIPSRVERCTDRIIPHQAGVDFVNMADGSDERYHLVRLSLGVQSDCRVRLLSTGTNGEAGDKNQFRYQVKNVATVEKKVSQALSLWVRLPLPIVKSQKVSVDLIRPTGVVHVKSGAVIGDANAYINDSKSCLWMRREIESRNVYKLIMQYDITWAAKDSETDSMP